MFGKQDRQEKQAAKKVAKDRQQSVDYLSIKIIRTTLMDGGVADCKFEITNGYGYIVKSGVWPGYNRTLTHARKVADKLRAKAGLGPLDYAVQTVSVARTVS
ncbi:hypothetical protein ACTWJ8_30725 [Streptomyces sp. SDT5-1]|uniref:hypothetical protein n=1 Tax=Streptomyces sp. SDT5-1 TaxID=3406418 RepID=UPI003FCF81A8